MFDKSKLSLLILATLAAATPVAAQTTTRRTTTTTTTPAPAPAPATQQTTTTTTTTTPARSRARRTTAAQSAANAGATEVRAAFDKLLDGIRAANVEQVMGVYWNSPQLIIFNNNGTVTRTWEQVRSNRESSYPQASDVSLDVRNVNVRMLGRDGAIVSALWTQSQTYKGAPESATGRMTVVFQKVGAEWKAVHTHTSPDAPDPSRLLPSERATPATVTPTEVVPGARPATPPATAPTRP